MDRDRLRARGNADDLNRFRKKVGDLDIVSWQRY